MAIPRTEKAYEKYAWMILFAMGALLILPGLDYILIGPSADVDFQPIAGTTWDEFSSTNAGVAYYVATILGLFGVTFLFVSFTAMAISLKSYRRGERWSWYTLWSLPILFGASFTIHLRAGAPYLVGSHLSTYFLSVFLIVSLLGLLLPYRKFFPSKPHL